VDIVPQLIVSGIAAGALYALVAVGLVLIYKSTHIVNFAQGEAVTIGAYLGWLYTAGLGLPYFAALGAVAVTAAAIGVVLERVAYRPLLNSPPFTLILATLAVGLIIKNSIRLVFQDMPHSMAGAVASGSIQFGDVYISPERLLIMIVVALIVVALGGFFRYTKTGKAMRATAQNQDAAALMGISVAGIFSRSWALGTALGGIAGVLIAPLIGVYIEIGSVLIPGFVAAVVGGFSSIPGAIVGGLMVGVLENFAGVFVSSALKQTISFLVLILVLMVKPSGLFGTPIRKAV
jgi:branched-chain amino acid transport system permease protein